MFKLVTHTATKPWLVRKMLPNINTWENLWSNFSSNVRVLTLKLLELTQFASPNYKCSLILLHSVPLCDVIKRTRFLMRPSFIISPWLKPCMTLRKCVADGEYMWKWMVQFLIKFHGRGIKISRIKSIRVDQK